MKKFTHRESECVKLEDGREIWLSRSVAVVGVVHDFRRWGPSETFEPIVLLTKRGPDCPDEVGKWCLPCGYLDWDEDGLDGFRREVFEETGVFVDMDSEDWSSVSDDPRQPWRVNAHPVNSNRQNISLYFSLEWRKEEPPPEPDLTNVDDGEVEEAKWMSVREALELDLAFNHRSVLEIFYKKFFN